MNQGLIATVLYFFYLCTIVVALYTVYKAIWYLIKIIRLRKHFEKLTQNGASIIEYPKLLDLLFSKIGEPKILIEKGDAKYEFNVISFISTRSRWNIEKARNNYYFEVRREAKLIPGKAKKHSISSHDYQKDVRFKKCILNVFDKKSDSDAKRILLIYPSPKVLTYTDSAFKKLQSGDMVEGYEIVFVNDLNELLTL